LKKTGDDRRELNDPHYYYYLRKVLSARWHQKKQRFPHADQTTNERGRRASSALAQRKEFVTNTWDSKAAAVRQLRLYVQRVRKVTIVAAGAWVLAVFWMRQWRSHCPFGLYLDNLLAPIALFVASYSIPMNLEQEEIPEDLEMSESRQPLLVAEDPS
jgi:hypothetical protein